jgi:hypothetical protein
MKPISGAGDTFFETDSFGKAAINGLILRWERGRGRSE